MVTIGNQSQIISMSLCSPEFEAWSPFAGKLQCHIGAHTPGRGAISLLITQATLEGEHTRKADNHQFTENVTTLKEIFCFTSLF